MSIITLEHIKNGYEICKTNHYFNSLKNLYKRLPETTCNCCGGCCVENPAGSFVEFLNFLNYLKNKVDKKIIVENAIRNNLTSLVESNNCIFLQSNKCSIYDVRPLNCRVFGLESEERYEKNYVKVKDENQKIKYVFKNEYDIDIIDNPKLQYCKNVKIINKKLFNDRDIDTLFWDLAKVEARFHKKGFPLNFDSYETYITHLVETELKMNFKEWGDLRVLVYKQIRARSTSIALEKFIKKINNCDFEFLKQ